MMWVEKADASIPSLVQILKIIT